MTEKEAYRILNLSPEAELSEIKKRYRQLISQVHPDIQVPSDAGCTCNAREINIAYSTLKKGKAPEKKAVSPNRKQRSEKSQKSSVWDAPVNPNAYTEREILHYVTDYDGTVLGNFSIAEGKYLWTTDEDFPLFLLSIYNCGKQLLDEADASLPRKKSSTVRHQLQAELTYLLAQQFIDSTALLGKLAKEETSAPDGSRIFFLSAMLEPSMGAPGSSAFLPAAGERLCPSGIRHHRLYLKNQSGKELGYLSFPDDRLYYVVVPLFEQKKVLVKIKAADAQNYKKRKTNASPKTPDCQPLHLWLKLSCETGNTMPENLNLQIAQLLEKYRKLA